MGRYNRKILHDLAETRILSSIANGSCTFQEWAHEKTTSYTNVVVLPLKDSGFYPKTLAVQQSSIIISLIRLNALHLLTSLFLYLIFTLFEFRIEVCPI